MKVETYTPGQPQISMTESARVQAEKEIRREQAQGIRLAVKESGCSGYMYVLDYVTDSSTTNDNDTTLPFGDTVTLFVDKESLPVVNGTEIDYVTEGVNQFFKFRNPNATGECGCGESFTVNE